MGKKHRSESLIEDDEWADDDKTRGRKKKTLRDFHRNGNHKVAFYEVEETEASYPFEDGDQR